MFDRTPAGGLHFDRCTNKQLYEYAQQYQDDVPTLREIRKALTSRKKEGADFARYWVDRKLLILERANARKRWYHSKPLQLSVVGLGAFGVGMMHGLGEALWHGLVRLLAG